MKRGEEWQTQKDIVDWFRKAHRDGIIYSVPNESCWKNKSYFEQTGMLSGVSDLIVIQKDAIHFIEVKSKTGRQSLEQKQFEKKLRELGYNYTVVRSLDEFKRIIDNKTITNQ